MNLKSKCSHARWFKINVDIVFIELSITKIINRCFQFIYCNKEEKLVKLVDKSQLPVY